MEMEYEEEKEGKEESCHHVRIEKADNGWVVEYSTKKKAKSKFENMSYMEHKKVFTDSDEDKAFEFFKKMKKSETKMMY